MNIRYSEIKTVYTDSSMSGFGALYNKDWLFGVWDGDSKVDLGHHEMAGPIEALPENISVLELYPVLCAAHKWGKYWKNSVVHLFTDNAAVEIMIRKGVSSNRLCMQMIREIFWVSCIYNFEIFSYHISSECNIFCDLASRITNKAKCDQFYEFNSNRDICCL